MAYKIDSELKNGLPENAYLLFGEEYFLVNSYKEKIINTLLKNPDVYDSEVTIFEGEKTSALKIIDSLEMISFMGTIRIVLCIDTGFFYKGNIKETDILTDYLKDSPDDFKIIFIEKSVDKRNKLYKAVQKIGFTEEFLPLKPDEMSKFILERVKSSGSSISESDARYISFNSYNQMENVLTEIDKLTSYKLNDTITKEDIDLLLTKNLEVRVFELVEKIGLKDSKSSISIFNNMILNKESPIMILTMIGRQFKILMMCKTLFEKGLSQDDIAKKTKLHPYVVKKNISQIKNFKKITLYNALLDVVETDEKIKTGQIKDTIAVETIILKYTT